jgi:hypothetical protein
MVMSAIKTIVGKLSLEELKPSPPNPAPKKVEEVSEEVVLELAKKITQPWTYGDCLSRFANQAGVSIQVVRSIKKEIDTRLELERLKEAATEETKE